MNAQPHSIAELNYNGAAREMDSGRAETTGAGA